MGQFRKILDKKNPVANTDTILYTVPAAKEAVANVHFANSSSTAAQIRIATVLSGASVNWALDSIINDLSITKDTPGEKTGIALGPDEDIVVRSDQTTTSFVATGMEIDQ